MTVPEGDEVSELERLDEALRWWENAVYTELTEAEENHVRELADAARAYGDLAANGERVEWCDEHNEHAHGKRFCAAGIDPSARTCHIVSRRLVDPPKEEADDG